MALPKGQGVLLPPFKAFLASNIPAVYDNTLSYYEELCTLIKYLETQVVPALNHNAEALTIVSNALEQLKQYVDDYFANLDVQEEINDKLDQMAEDGTLQEIITTYIQANVEWTFDTVADMKSATNLVNGSYAQTLGYHSVNDGGGAIYKITNTGSTNEFDKIAIGDLIANLMNGKSVKQFGAYGDNNHDDTETIQYVITNYQVIYIPKGTYKITDELDLKSQRHIYGDGQMSVLKSYYSSSSVKYILKSASDETSIQRTIIENLSFENNDIENVAGGIYIEYALRGVSLHNLWFSLSNPIKLGSKTWGIIDVSNIFATYLPTTGSADSCGLYAEGNTVYANNIELIGNYNKGIYLNTVNVAKLNNLNVSGSTDDHLMINGITIEASNDIEINTGWFESITENSDTINSKAINIVNSTNVRVINAHIAVASMFVDGSTGVVLENNRYYKSSAGLRILNGSKITSDSISLGYVNYQMNATYMNGEVKVIDIPNTSETNIWNNSLLLDGVTNPITRTNNTIVTASYDTTNFYSGDRSVNYTTTASSQGARITLNDKLEVGKTYTLIAVVRGVENIERIYFNPNGFTNVSNYPNQVIYPSDTNWHVIRYTGTVNNASNRIDIDATLTPDSANGTFAIDSVYIVNGIHNDTIPSTLDKKQFMKFNKLYNATAPSSGTWVAGDIVYNDFSSDTTTIYWVYNGASWTAVTM